MAHIMCKFRCMISGNSLLVFLSSACLNLRYRVLCWHSFRQNYEYIEQTLFFLSLTIILASCFLKPYTVHT
jgi:hypothetical protein